MQTHVMTMEQGVAPIGAVSRAPLSQALREQTADIHLVAEKSGVISDILRRKASRESYAALLRNLVPAYEVLERALIARGDHAVHGAFASPALFRAAALRSDLAVLSGPDWERELPLLEPARAYAARIADASSGDGLRLIPHAYVRYFGDLSGGQILKKLLGESMSLPPDALSLYDFPDVEDIPALKNQLREAVDRAGDAAIEPQELIDETIAAFELNIALSHAVQDWVRSGQSRAAAGVS